MSDDLRYDRTLRPLEVWSAILAVADHPAVITEEDLEAAISLAIDHSKETSSPRAKCLAQYVLGKALLLLRAHYPEWSVWVAHSAVLSSEWGFLAEDETLKERSEALFIEYIRLIASPPNNFQVGPLEKSAMRDGVDRRGP